MEQYLGESLLTPQTTTGKPLMDVAGKPVPERLLNQDHMKEPPVLLYMDEDLYNQQIANGDTKDPMLYLWEQASALMEADGKRLKRIDLLPGLETRAYPHES